ncbi:MAG: response regulator [Desulfobulbaceae bacterium]|nr:response regulator [Desulfobulbaceae bacterium]HIJ78481.1 response regulator [Deltaproteobacteria bacterium]
MSFDRNMTVLVVDDSAVMRRIIIRHLLGMGISSVCEVNSAEKALAVLGRQKIDLVLSDWCMPGMQGIDLLRRLRADAATKDLPFIMISAEAQPHLLLEAIQAKVSEYVVKPFTRPILEESIERAFRLSNFARL